jgi:hypothetical protein
MQTLLITFKKSRLPGVDVSEGSGQSDLAASPQAVTHLRRRRSQSFRFIMAPHLRVTSASVVRIKGRITAYISGACHILTASKLSQ